MCKPAVAPTGWPHSLHSARPPTPPARAQRATLWRGTYLCGTYVAGSLHRSKRSDCAGPLATQSQQLNSWPPKQLKPPPQPIPFSPVGLQVRRRQRAVPRQRLHPVLRQDWRPGQRRGGLLRVRLCIVHGTPGAACGLACRKCAGPVRKASRGAGSRGPALTPACQPPMLVHRSQPPIPVVHGAMLWQRIGFKRRFLICNDHLQPFHPTAAWPTAPTPAPPTPAPAATRPPSTRTRGSAAGEPRPRAATAHSSRALSLARRKW